MAFDKNCFPLRYINISERKVTTYVFIFVEEKGYLHVRTFDPMARTGKTARAQAGADKLVMKWCLLYKADELL